MVKWTAHAKAQVRHIHDYIAQDSALCIQDKAMLNRWQSLETLQSEDRERILYVIDSLMRDAKTRQAYHTGV